MIVLQVVRVFLERYRHDDGTQRGGARDQAAAATAEVLATIPEKSGPAAEYQPPQLPSPQDWVLVLERVKRSCLLSYA